MKILFQSRLDLYETRGGDTTQMEYTKKYIEMMYPDIKIEINNELNPQNIAEYDLVQLFNLDWVCETYPQAKWAKSHNKKIILSAIHHSEKEVLRYENEYRFDFRRIYNVIFPNQALRDVGKNIYRSVFDYRKLYPAFMQLVQGIRFQQRETLKMSDLIFIQTHQEAKDIQADFGITIPQEKFVKVVNGINSKIFSESDNKSFISKVKDLYDIDLTNKLIILNVGRIEPRKNQLSLIEAFNNIKDMDELNSVHLIFIGDMGKRSPEYIHKFKNEIGEDHRILYISAKPQEFIASAMSHKGIYVQPSWFETTGLVALEAAGAGMSVVASGERIKEYLGDEMVNCDPGIVKSIQNGILEALKKQKDGVISNNLSQKVMHLYTWEHTARQTVEAYHRLLQK